MVGSALCLVNSFRKSTGNPAAMNFRTKNASLLNIILSSLTGFTYITAGVFVVSYFLISFLHSLFWHFRSILLYMDDASSSDDAIS